MLLMKNDCEKHTLYFVIPELNIIYYPTKNISIKLFGDLKSQQNISSLDNILSNLIKGNKVKTPDTHPDEFDKKVEKGRVKYKHKKPVGNIQKIMFMEENTGMLLLMVNPAIIYM